MKDRALVALAFVAGIVAYLFGREVGKESAYAEVEGWLGEEQPSWEEIQREVANLQ